MNDDKLYGMRSCATCGHPFSPRRGGKPQKYCSKTCRERAYKPIVTTGDSPRCLMCGKPMPIRKRQHGHPRRWCSQRCLSRAGTIARYGLTLEAYRALLEAQRGMCAICGKPPRGKRLHIDHDHDTGVVRGLLCPPCNRHLGHFEAHSEAVMRYLGRYPEGFDPERSINRG